MHVPSFQLLSIGRAVPRLRIPGFSLFSRGFFIFYSVVSLFHCSVLLFFVRQCCPFPSPVAWLRHCFSDRNPWKSPSADLCQASSSRQPNGARVGRLRLRRGPNPSSGWSTSSSPHFHDVCILFFSLECFLHKRDLTDVANPPSGWSIASPRHSIFSQAFLFLSLFSDLRAISPSLFR